MLPLPDGFHFSLLLFWSLFALHPYFFDLKSHKNFLELYRIIEFQCNEVSKFYLFSTFPKHKILDNTVQNRIKQEI